MDAEAASALGDGLTSQSQDAPVESGPDAEEAPPWTGAQAGLEVSGMASPRSDSPSVLPQVPPPRGVSTGAETVSWWVDWLTGGQTRTVYWVERACLQASEQASCRERTPDGGGGSEAACGGGWTEVLTGSDGRSALGGRQTQVSDAPRCSDVDVTQ